jgi:hypothetical protein
MEHLRFGRVSTTNVCSHNGENFPHPLGLGAWAMPMTILKLPTRRIKMKREPHSKYTFAITEFKLQVTWNDGIVEDLTPHLPPELQANIEEYLVEMDDLRTQNPATYF